MYQPIVPKKVQPQHTIIQDSTSKNSQKEREVFETIPIEQRWDFVVHYHDQHSEIMEPDLGKRLQLLVSARDNQTAMESDDSAGTLIYYPRKAGLGNTVTALANVLFLSIASNRRFFGSFKQIT